MVSTAADDGSDQDELASWLDPQVAMALRQWALADGGLVGLPARKWRASGYTGAVLTTILFHVPHPRGGLRTEKWIIKVIPAGDERETGLHSEAWRQNEGFAERHLVRQLGRPWPVGDGRFIMFQDIAGDQLDYRPVDKLGDEAQAVCCAAAARLVLTEWNGDQWLDGTVPYRDIVQGYLHLELRKPIEKIERWAAREGLAQRGAEWVSAPTAKGGEQLPNPIAMVRSGLSVRRVLVQYLSGRSHGDLHRGNILAPYREPAPGERPVLPLPEEIKIVDLAAFHPAAPLTRDLVALSLSIAAAQFETASSADEKEALLRVLLDVTGRSTTAPLAIGETLRAVQRAAGLPRQFLAEWHDQYLLSLLAGALRNTSYRNHSGPARHWLFRVAARAAAEFLLTAEREGLIPAEPATDEAPDQVIISLVSAVADRAAAYDLRTRLVRHADAARLSWTVDVRLNNEERSASHADRLQIPDVVVVHVSERSVIDPGCRSAIEAAESGGIRVIRVRVDATAARVGNLRDDMLEAGEDGFAELTRRITAISFPRQVRRDITEKLARTEAEGSQATGLLRRRLDEYSRDLRVRLEEEQRRTTGTSARQDESEPSDLTRETVADHEVRLVNEAPAVTEGVFRDRVPEMHSVEDAIAETSILVVVVQGAIGAGKTAFAAELRRRLAAPRPRTEVDAVVYLSADGYRPITVAAVLLDLVRSLPPGVGRARLTERLTDPIEWREKLTEVLAALTGRTVVVILDAAEHLLDPAGDFRDRDLGTLVREVAGRSGHAATLVLTMADGAPQRIRRQLPSNVSFVTLDRGLPFDDTIKFLSAMDRSAALGLSALALPDAADRHRVYQVSGGHPRTLELLAGVLRLEPGRFVSDLLDDLEQVAPEDVAAKLFDRTFGNLDRTEQRVVQALAAYGRPVPAAAVDFLLERSVKGVDSSPVLRGLWDRRIARQDQGHYFLPPAESARVLDAMPRGELNDHGHPRPPLTRFALLYRAAAYFKGLQVAEINSLLDLRPHFSEIDLRIRAWDYHRAVQVMNHIEDEYLRPWGQSDALLEWRRAVQGAVGNDAEEADNRRRMVAALQQQENVGAALAELKEARKKCSWLELRARNTLNIQMATVRFEAGEFSRAGRQFRRHLWHCRLGGGTRRNLIAAQAGLALSLGRTGRHTPALRAFAKARRSAHLLPRADRDRVLPTLLANNAWVLGQVDDPQAALELLREGRSVASAATRDELGLGLCLNGEAAVLIDSGTAEDAVEPARRAAEIGVLTRDPRLIRQANLNLGLAYLCLDLDRDALDTAEISARLDRGPRAVGAYGLLGIAAFRREKPDRARLAFLTARDTADEQIGRERNDYLAWDARGLACFGLALIEVEQTTKRLAEAGEAFERARRITGAAGAVSRNTILLGNFGERADNGLVAAMTAVAGGAQSPFDPPDKP